LCAQFHDHPLPALAPVAPQGDADSQPQSDTVGVLARQAASKWPIQQAGQPQGATKPSADPFDALKSTVESVNMNILTLQEQGWEVDAEIDEGGFIQMRVLRRIN